MVTTTLEMVIKHQLVYKTSYIHNDRAPVNE